LNQRSPSQGWNEAAGRTLEPLLASLLRRDFGLAGALSVLGGEETGGFTFAEMLSHQREPEAGPLPCAVGRAEVEGVLESALRPGGSSS
jgi:hypothetical protein